MNPKMGAKVVQKRMSLIQNNSGLQFYYIPTAHSILKYTTKVIMARADLKIEVVKRMLTLHNGV